MYSLRMRRTKLWNIFGLANEFVGHWEATDAELGAPLVLPSGATLASFSALRDACSDQATVVVGEENDRGWAMADANRLDAELIPAARQFNALVRARFPDSIYLAVVDPFPNAHAARSKQLDAYERIENLWGTINANAPPYPGFTPPLLLPNGMDLAAFSTKIGELRTASGVLGDRRQAERLARAGHRDLADQLWGIMVEYRRIVLAVLPDTPLALSLPRISPRRKKKKAAEDTPA